MIEQTLTKKLKKYITTLSENDCLVMQQNLLDQLNKGILGDEHNAEFDFITHCIGLHRKLSTMTVKTHNSYCGVSSPELKFYTLNGGDERKSGYVSYDQKNGYYFGVTKRKAIEQAIYSKTITWTY